MAPFVKQVIGIDASKKRIEVCKDNAKRLGIKNTQFIYYSSGSRLPFPDNFFDGIMAASSIEQTPNSKETLKELYRVLKPSGKIRIYYEALNRYKNGKENDIWIAKLNQQTCKLILYFRNIEEEYAIQYGLTISLSKEELIKLLGETTFNSITIEFLETIKPLISKAQFSKLQHPSGQTYTRWLKEIGFKKNPTNSWRS
ncbi:MULTISPECIES: class I SAM-dependent methyltransferase [unclassified Thermosipho (in: thermotogales)]|uniref:class I SAM-dependent methyltransferase n=1 Tax=Thermosipho sp. 1244 TaxID=1755816 RepID=UPI001E4C78DA|nr:class I SAM-dependent methyltransferase [Thermosipho sp. 1223]